MGALTQPRSAPEAHLFAQPLGSYLELVVQRFAELTLSCVTGNNFPTVLGKVFPISLAIQLKRLSGRPIPSVSTIVRHLRHQQLLSGRRKIPTFISKTNGRRMELNTAELEDRQRREDGRSESDRSGVDSTRSFPTSFPFLVQRCCAYTLHSQCLMGAQPPRLCAAL